MQYRCTGIETFRFESDKWRFQLDEQNKKNREEGRREENRFTNIVIVITAM